MANLSVNKEDSFDLMALTGGAGLTPDEIAEELGGDIPEYPRVKIPSGGAVFFEVPGDDPENPEAAKELAGVVVLHHKTNAYWTSSDLSDSPPDCSSIDGIMGEGAPGGACERCPYNQMGSGEGGRGKACKNMERLYILRPGSLMPMALSLPPTSLRPWKTYKTLLISKGKKVCDVMTKITLTKKQSKDGNPYAESVFKMGDPLPQKLAQAAYQYRKGVKSMVDAGHAMAVVRTDAYIEVENNEVFVDHSTGEVIAQK